MFSSWKSWCACVPQRWVLTILASAGCCIGNVYIAFLSITIIEMVEQTVSSNEPDSGSCPSSHNTTSMDKIFLNHAVEESASIKCYQWDEYTQGIILSSFSWSYTACRLFYGPVADRFGGKHTLGLGIFVQAIITIFTPFLVDWGGSSALIISRVLIGVANSGMYPAICKLLPNWTTPANRTTMGNAIYSGGIIGLLLGNIMPALVIKYSGMGWSAAFYLAGILGVVWFPIWLIFAYESPESHPFVTEKELQFLQRNVEVDKLNSKLPPTPWKHIFLCKEFWAFTIIYSGSNWAFYAMLTGLPRYMSNVVKFSLESNGYFSSLPYVFMWLNSTLSAWISDKVIEKQWISLTNMRKILGTVSVMGPAIFLLLASYSGCDKTTVAVMFVIGIAFFGNFVASIMLNPLDLSPNYAASLMAIGEGIASTSGIFAPYIIGALAPDSTLSEWRTVFWIIFFFAVVPNAVYLVWFKAEVQPWDDPNFVRSEIEIKLHKLKKEIIQDLS